MAGLSPQGDAMRSPAAVRRLREARRRRNLRRRTTALLLLLGSLTALYFAADWAITHWLGGRKAAAVVEKPPQVPAGGGLPFTPERYLTLADLDGDGQAERIAVGAADGVRRKVALITGTDKAPKVVGEPITVPDFPLAVAELPRAHGVLVLAGKLPADGEPKQVQVRGEKAVQAAGGEPDFRAWQPDPALGLIQANYYQLIAPVEPPEPDTIIVDKWLNVLWAYQKGQLVHTARVATGRHLQGPQPSAANQAQNLVTPVGRFPISNMQPGMVYYQGNIPKGDPRNPLGTRWLGFSVYPGDRAAIWAIHGTNEPDSIGRWASDGCIRMANAEVEALYSRVKEGTPLTIVSSQP